MLKKTIKYTDYNGQPQEEDFYFNLSKAEVLEMQFSDEGTLEDYVNRIVKENNQKKIYALFKNIIMKAYGEKSPDGKRFIKSDEMSEAFTQTEAFSELVMEFFRSDPEKEGNAAAEFVRAIIPADLNT